MLKDMGLGWVLVIGVFVLLAMMFMFATPASVENARKVEHRSMQRLMGEMRAQQATEWANYYFGKHWVRSGIVGQVQAMYIPTDENKRKAKGLENLLPGWFAFWQTRIDGFWGMLHGSYKRLHLMWQLLPYGVTLLLVALIQGLVNRKVVIGNKDVANAVYFHGAKKVLYALILAPFFILFWPWAVTNLIWFGWFTIMPVAVWMASQNVQEL
jgi:hypothetical protein